MNLMRHTGHRHERNCRNCHCRFYLNYAPRCLQLKTTVMNALKRSLGGNYFRLKCEPFKAALRRRSGDTAVRQRFMEILWRFSALLMLLRIGIIYNTVEWNNSNMYPDSLSTSFHFSRKFIF